MDRDSNNYYLTAVENKINKLNYKKEQYELKLTKEKEILKKNNSDIEKLKFEKDILRDGYNSLLELLQSDGMIFEMNFSQYKPHQWENLFLVKTIRGYEIQTKAGSNLMMLDKNISKILKDISKRDSYSLIVIRTTDKTALVQLRFK
ncbi:hypothetical protein [Clostridium sp.]|uniref:hypothetical protein n=1 Tax=Clostridium sp. TaxID=1506 RepID=UPI003D6CD513